MFSKGEGKDLGHMAVNTQRLVGKEWDAQEGEYKRKQETENILNVLYTFIKCQRAKLITFKKKGYQTMNVKAKASIRAVQST